MAFSARLSGPLEVAAALAFHLPGTRLDLSSPNGAQCSVGPLTDPRCSLHPAEFRELVMVAGTGGLLGSMLGYELEDNPQISLAAAEGVEHLGGGLYQVTGRDSVSFAFATTLQASHVDAVLSNACLSEVNAGRDGQAAPGREDDATIAVSLIQDDGLGVTLVVICAPDMAETAVGACVAQQAVTACLVAEMEQLAAGSDG